MATLKNVYGVTHTGGTTDHNRLYNRDLENQHPISAINGLTKELQELDDKITEKVLEESSARKSADSILQVNINSEATTRLNKDTELQNNINDLAIVVAGKIDKTYVDSKVLSEETARINADNTLQNNINTKVSQTEYNAKISSIETSLSNKANISYVDEKLALKANQSDLNALGNRVVIIETDYLKTADKTELQSNINNLNSELNNTKTRVSTLEETVGDSTKGLVKGLADEIIRATDKEGELQTNINTEKTERQTKDNELTERIQNLESRGRFLSTWNAVTGKPETEPTSLPYLLKAGDYFIVSVVADSGAQNKRPEAKLSEGKYYYDGTASVTVETQKLSKNDYYTFDGTKYILINGTVKDITFANIAGDAESNINLKGKLDNKISLLGNETGSGESYHFTYYYDIQPKEDRYDISIDTITLDNNKTLKKYNYSIPAANTSLAGLMSKDDKVKLEALRDLLRGDNIHTGTEQIRIPYYFDVKPEADKIKVTARGVSLDANNNIVWEDSESLRNTISILPATITTAGLMSSADKAILDDLNEKFIITFSRVEAVSNRSGYELTLDKTREEILAALNKNKENIFGKISLIDGDNTIELTIKLSSIKKSSSVQILFFTQMQDFIRFEIQLEIGPTKMDAWINNFDEDYDSLASYGDILELDEFKQDKLTAGNNITIENNTISASDSILIYDCGKTYNYAETGPSVETYDPNFIAALTKATTEHRQFAIKNFGISWGGTSYAFTQGYFIATNLRQDEYGISATFNIKGLKGNKYYSVIFIRSDANNVYLHISDNCDNKLDKENPTGTGSFSLNRLADTAIGTNSVAVGNSCAASGDYSCAEGERTVAEGSKAHAEGDSTLAKGTASHAEGYKSKANSNYSHAEGYETKAEGVYAHTEGLNTIASGTATHAEGLYTTASNESSHAEGSQTIASGNQSHAEGCFTQALGQTSHTEGYYTIANHKSQHVFGEYNTADASTAESSVRGNYVEIVGNGTSSVRSNARTLDWNGNEIISGKLQVGVDQTATGYSWGAKEVVTKEYLDTVSGNIEEAIDIIRGV